MKKTSVTVGSSVAEKKKRHAICLQFKILITHNKQHACVNVHKRLASSRQGAAQKTVHEKIIKKRAVFCAVP